MFRPIRHDHPSRLIAFRAYLYVILACSLLLFSLSLISLVRQQDTLKRMSLDSLRFGGERIAFELESRVPVLAAELLRSDRLKALTLPSSEWLTPGQARDLRRRFEELSRAYPIADGFVVVKGSTVLFPLVGRPPGEPAGDRGAAGRQFDDLISQGAKIAGMRPLQALEFYRRAEALDVPLPRKAFASSLQAELFYQVGGLSAATERYRGFLQAYGDQYDKSQVPYRVSLTLLPERIARGIYDPYPPSRVYEDLANGRWEMSTHQVDRWLSLLEQKLGLDPRSRPSSRYLDNLNLASAVVAALQNNPRLASERTWHAVKHGGRAFQTYFTSLPGSGHDAAVGFSVSLPCVRDRVLPEIVSGVLGNPGAFAAAIEDSASPAPPGADDLVIPFGSPLAPWKLRIPGSSIQLKEAAVHREVWFVGLASVMFLSILSLGVYLLIRVARDLQWFKLQSEFVGGVSHELKTPLSLIRLYSETLAEDENAFPPEERKSYLRIIARESERLSRLIDNVLDFSQIQQGRKHSVLEEGNLAETVAQTVSDYSEYLELRGFAVRTGIQPNLPPVRFNAEQVSQLVLNLMDNARKYSGNSKLIRVHMWREGPEVVLEVQDYGIGIPPEERQKIFRPFYRIQRAGGQGGCGLGLYLVRHVVEAHGGRIEVHGEVDHGSRFRVFFSISGETAGHAAVSQVGSGGHSLFEPR